MFPGISPALMAFIMSSPELDKFSQHQKHGAFILTAVVVILLVVKKFFIATRRSNLICL